MDKIISLSKFRTGPLQIPAVRERLFLNAVHESTCQFCGKHDILDEIHYFISCSGLTHLRVSYFPNLEHIPKQLLPHYFEAFITCKGLPKLLNLSTFCKAILKF